jgi:hypothetical protein
METKNAIDARPILPISEKSLWDRAAERRDEIASRIDAEFNKRNITAWIRKSKPGEYPLYVVVNSWIQVLESDLAVTFDKSSLKVTISVDPYREYPLIYKVELNHQGREFSHEHYTLSLAEISELARYLIEDGSKPSFFKPRVPLIERIIGAFIPSENKLIPEARPNYWTLPMVLGWGGIVVAVGLAIGLSEPYADNTGLHILCALVGIATVVVAVALSKRRPAIEAIPKQSLRTPRREYRVDSWHVSVPCAGEQFEQFRERLYTAVSAKARDIEMNLERHQNLTPRGFEERERLVLSKGQATLHIHVYPFSNDAFVGWESYLNWNRWAESKPVSTTVRDGRKVTYRSLEVGVHFPTDFDLIEANVLAETTHRVLVDEIKTFLKEREIEADLDFKIIRGDRSNALKAGKDGE